MPRFNEQFFGGLLTGAVLATLLVGSFAFSRIEANRKFADATSDLV